ncbi:uncharacterized protein LOC143664825 isoform X2 [Tamandua tetradactyla]|uniref:uncharacterized protein LOC143664825 isoform X2 n=1 Tax=Tamandua tetradactyla TaxID=48850 RepID=UPI0040544623
MRCGGAITASVGARRTSAHAHLSPARLSPVGPPGVSVCRTAEASCGPEASSFSFWVSVSFRSAAPLPVSSARLAALGPMVGPAGRLQAGSGRRPAARSVPEAAGREERGAWARRPGSSSSHQRGKARDGSQGHTAANN